MFLISFCWGNSALPFGDGLTRDVQRLCKLLLRKTALFAQCVEFFRQCHGSSFRKKHSVSVRKMPCIAVDNCATVGSNEDFLRKTVLFLPILPCGGGKRQRRAKNRPNWNLFGQFWFSSVPRRGRSSFQAPRAACGFQPAGRQACRSAGRAAF